MKFDFIIIGQGIAGTCFAFELLKHNKTFIIVDNPIKQNLSSRVALGIYNPLVLKWFTKAWNVENQLEYFYDFYARINTFFNDSFVSDTGVYKLLKTAYDQNTWLSKSFSSKRFQYMSNNLLSIDNPSLRNNNFYGFVKSAGRVNVKKLLDSFRNYCLKKRILIEEKFDYNKLIISPNSVSFKNIVADKIIFCQGYQGFGNPYFDNLNFKPTKGEILNIYSKDLRLKHIIHSRFLFTPIGNDHYAIGATYNWENINIKPSSEAKKKLVSQLDSILKIPYTITNQIAGIRPSTADRKPLIGRHEQYKQLYILNGLGTRGILLAPYLSKCLIEYIYKDVLIDHEININRCH